MLFGYFTLFVALLIEIVGAYYSITGLAAIFSGAVIPILIMGGSLELGKVVAAVWLKNNWERAGITYKLYLLPAVAMLMLITSMGIFGFLSKAHNDQTLVSGDVGSKIAIYDEKIRTAKENIEADRKQLKQMDEAVDQVMGRSTDEKGADKANSIRKSQQRDRGALARDIETQQKLIAQLNDEAAPIRAEVRKVEAEVGPIKYIAKLIYEDNPDSNILEKAVTWVIMIIVAVFDPLALVLILAAQQSIRWAQGEEPKPKKESVESWFDRARKRARFWDRKQEEQKEDKVDFEGVRLPGGEWIQTGPAIPVPENKPVDTDNLEPVFERETDIPAYEPDDGPLTDQQIEQIREIAKDDLPTGNVVIEYLLFPQPEPEPVIPPVVEEAVITTLGDDYIEINGKRMHHKAFDPQSDHAAHAVERHIEKTQATPPGSDGNLWVSQEDGTWVNAGPADQFNLGLAADNGPNSTTGEMRGFGTSFPTNVAKGDMFLRVDQLPSALYKFNGTNWIEVDKALSDQHAYDEAYIDHLIEKISTGEYDPDLLSNAERDSIEQRLSNNPRRV
jgi:hypothetical protein